MVLVVVLYLLLIVGWLFMAFAISLGTPFCYGLLNRIATIRSTIKPPTPARGSASSGGEKKRG
jgi:hypothetical protein